MLKRPAISCTEQPLLENHIICNLRRYLNLPSLAATLIADSISDIASLLNLINDGFLDIFILYLLALLHNLFYWSILNFSPELYLIHFYFLILSAFYEKVVQEKYRLTFISLISCERAGNYTLHPASEQDKLIKSNAHPSIRPIMGIITIRPRVPYPSQEPSFKRG